LSRPRLADRADAAARFETGKIAAPLIHELSNPCAARERE
jgi:hypothetical protein